jgi:hypothetical protein
MILENGENNCVGEIMKKFDQSKYRMRCGSRRGLHGLHGHKEREPHLFPATHERLDQMEAATVTCS